jgi:radical SAM protein with 4Fe4S-binding SPASM domain
MLRNECKNVMEVNMLKTNIVKERSDGVIRISNKSFDRYMSNHFGDRYWDYRESWDNPTGLKYPVQINLEVNDKCNLRCKMCPRSSNKYNLNTGTKMPLSLFKKIIDEKQLQAIAFGGGDEPLLNKDLPQMVKYASIRGVMDIRVTTNGTMLNRNLSEQLMENGVTWLSVSIDAFTKDKYKQIRPGSNLDLVENNVKNFIQLKKSLDVNLPVLRVSFIDMDFNRDEIDLFLDKWVKLIDYVDIQRYVSYVDNGTKKLVKQFKCLDPFRRLWVKANGDVYPCCNFLCVKKEHNDELLLGNINQDSIQDIWDGKKLMSIQKQVSSCKNLPYTCIDCMQRWNRNVE